MNIFKNKKLTTSIALLLMLTLTAITMVPPPVNAAEVGYHSYIYCSVANSVIGIGQTQLIVTWTADMPPDVGEQTSAQGRAHWSDIVVTVTDPDGANTTLNIPTTDSIGGGYVNYTPEKLGTYTVQVYMPKQVKYTASTNTTATYTEARSPPLTFTAQQDPVEKWTESPLPDGYWSRPINQASRDWYVLGGNWLSGAHEQPAGKAGGTTTRWVEGQATETSHVLWAKPRYEGGGYMEGRFEQGFQTGHYQGLDFSAIVINGKMYYPYRDTAHTSQGFVCVDLYTGETLKNVNQTMPSFGQIYNYDSGNQHGGFAYLWRISGVNLPSTVQVPNTRLFPNGSVIQLGTAQAFNLSQVTTGTVWEMVDANTLQTVCYIANVTQTEFRPGGPVNAQGRPTGVSTGATGTAVYGKDGSILRYNLVNLGSVASPQYYLQLWNSSAGTMVSSQTGTGYWQWRPMGGTFGGANPYLGSLAYNYMHDGNDFFVMNISIPTNLVSNPSALNQNATIQCVREGEYLIIGVTGSNTETGLIKGRMVSLSLEKGKEGTVIWDRTFTPPFTAIARNETAASGFGGGFSLTGVYPEDGVICFHNTKLLTRWGISLETGEELWKSDPEPQNNYYTMISNYYNWNGKSMLLTGGYGGVILAYDIKTGDILWNFTASNIGSESPYGNYPINIFAIADGKIYTLSGEHSVTQPMWRGPNLRCINATDGTEIWNLMGMSANGGAHLTGQYAQMADGKVLALNYYDNRIYCIGKGSSATTVLAPSVVPTVGGSVMLTGTVTDSTPGGSRNVNDKVDMVLAGTPAISDEDMGRWMEYLYMDQVKPDASGVPVTLTAIDPNGNFVEIGTVTSDINGNFGISYTPEVAGTYQITASFAGSKAYGASQATTYMALGETSATNTPAPPTGPSIADQYLIPATIGIIVAIAIATIVIVLALRKRP